MKINLLLLLSLLSGTSLPVTSGARAGVSRPSPIPPSITVSDAVGGDPGTVYTAGRAQRTVSVAWNAGSDYPYYRVVSRATVLGDDGKAAAVGPPWSIMNH
jgi:hypothetical protein